MTPKNKYERNILKIVRSLTNQFEASRSKSGHFIITFQGVRKAKVIFAKSPSDHRATKNTLSDLRRAMARAQVEPKEA